MDRRTREALDNLNTVMDNIYDEVDEVFEKYNEETKNRHLELIDYLEEVVHYITPIDWKYWIVENGNGAEVNILCPPDVTPIAVYSPGIHIGDFLGYKQDGVIKITRINFRYDNETRFLVVLDMDEETYTVENDEEDRYDQSFLFENYFEPKCVDRLTCVNIV